ncbi:MAG: T9SS type A sorting domain-containing protein [Candidatus Eisenbacteria bacterium]|nr:T9SS type A sorting domain-containing protein [Candidatus Latescibacterota bacterium]MBD3302821.1 T9SS type A sorting domain-containing protein [Candidatus Eisenbacteria bacterium]
MNSRTSASSTHRTHGERRRDRPAGGRSARGGKSSFSLVEPICADSSVSRRMNGHRIGHPAQEDRMDRIRIPLTASVVLLVGSLFAGTSTRGAEASPPPVRAPEAALSTGILLDRVVSLADVGTRDGSAGSAPAGFDAWRQILHEMRRASLEEPGWPSLETIRARQRAAGPNTILLGVLHLEYERIRDAAWADGAAGVRDGAIVLSDPTAVSRHRLFAVAPMEERTYRGAEVSFRIPRDLVLTNDREPITEIAIDFGDGLGFRPVALDRAVTVRYAGPGEKTIQVRARAGNGLVLHATTRLNVLRLQTPTPDDTLSITAMIPYQGEAGTGEAYVYLADTHAELTDPILIPEGFDLDNTLDWDDYYALLNEQELLETFRDAGHDIVLLDFTDATTYIQRNAFVFLELIERVRALIDPATDVAVAGPSMGGLIARYTLAYREANGYETNERIFLSFDAPQRGANIPLGIQYWIAFFADQSAEAAAFLEALDSPASRQMLLTHHTDPPEAVPTADPLRGALLADLAAIGDYPTAMRKVTIANGSGSGLDQGYAAGTQIIEWEYESFLIDVTGNCWAVPDGPETVIFHGLIDPIFLPAEEQTVAVSGTWPYDNAPGGWRDSMTDMDEVEAPYGDIVALQANHGFIPSISALALDVDDPFFDIAGDPDLLARTPFDAVYFPVENQEHAAITPENKQWILDEVLRAPADVAGGGSIGARIPRLHAVFPNPASGAAEIRFDLPAAGPVRLSLFDPAGRRVAVLQDRSGEAGTHRLVWDGVDAGGRAIAPGVYFLRLDTETGSHARKLIRR